MPPKRSLRQLQVVAPPPSDRSLLGSERSGASAPSKGSGVLGVPLPIMRLMSRDKALSLNTEFRGPKFGLLHFMDRTKVGARTSAHYCKFNPKHRVSASTAGSEARKSNPARIVDKMEAHWKLPDPEVILWVTGQVEGRVLLDPRTEDSIKRGLTRLVRSTDAWIMTAGMEGGVMSFVGEAVGGFGDTPCVGVCSLQKVTDQQHIKPSFVYTASGRTAAAASPAGHETVGLQNHHTHTSCWRTPRSPCMHGQRTLSRVWHACVWHACRSPSRTTTRTSCWSTTRATTRASSREIAPPTPCMHGHVHPLTCMACAWRTCRWGAEISLFDAILDRMSRERHVPLVTLVIRGQIGALQDVLDALDSSG